VARVPAPEHLKAAVDALSSATGIEFAITDHVVTGTQLHAVYARQHSLPERYNQTTGVLGFRIPMNYPDASPEDCFFLQTSDPLKLASPDPTRNSTDVYRASLTPDFLKGTVLADHPALVFSWHLWDRSPWNRRQNTLIDHYTHCLRRFDGPEHD
jgi:hypothetical protein